MKDIKYLLDNNVKVNEALELFGDIETYNETLKDFVASIPEKLSKVKEYKENTDMPNYAIYVHSLKSDAAYFGFSKLQTCAYNHEIESKANNFMFVYENYDELINYAYEALNIARTYLGMEEVKHESVVNEKTKEHAILVVDDSDIIRAFVKKIFKDEYDVLIASDGNEALDAVKKAADGYISCMLLDLNMPNVNGFDVLNYFQKNSLFNKVPVSIITGVSEKETIDKAFNYPIVDVLTKPFNERDVKLIIEKTIKKGL